MSVTLHTSHGNIKIELFIEAAPLACTNFLALCASNYYNGCIWHRIMKGFIIQTGDPTGQGKGGNSIWGIPFKDEFKSYLKYDRPWLVGMANMNKPDTNSSQFFITCNAQPGHLNNKFTLFGRIIHGIDVVQLIEKEPVDDKYRPINKNVIITSATIHSNPIAEHHYSTDLNE